MVRIPDIIDKIPLMFRAQTKGRSRLHFIDSKSNEQDSQRWLSEWIKGIEHTYLQPPEFGTEVEANEYKTHEYQISWRFVTNGGRDEGIIRPVIGAYGLPFYRDSSMKGAFCQACTPKQKQRYHLDKDSDNPSLLRFHGGYPINDNWTENLLDIVHPQQGWQVKTHDTRQKPTGESGFALISLYQPTLKFGISSLLPETDWAEIWRILELALESGLGCRVSSGYGLPKDISPSTNVLAKCFLRGQGMAPETLDRTSEFRPNIFRGAIRGHALRIFGGLTDAKNAESLVDGLFGGIQGEGIQGLPAINFQATSLVLGTFSDGYDEPTYKVIGELSWILTRSLAEAKKQCLSKLIRFLTYFGMLLGGFGKSWRRADHRLFYEDYYPDKPLIGCHWQGDKSSLMTDNKVRNLNHVKLFLEEVRKTAREWMTLQNIPVNSNSIADWRESWYPDKVEVLGRLADNKDDSLAIHWFHKSYQSNLSIKRTSVTGSIEGRTSQIGRLWHRMYPIINIITEENGKKKPKNTHQYLELITIFPDDSRECREFRNFLNISQQKEGKFQKLWPTNSSEES